VSERFQARFHNLWLEEERGECVEAHRVDLVRGGVEGEEGLHVGLGFGGHW